MYMSAYLSIYMKKRRIDRVHAQSRLEGTLTKLGGQYGQHDSVVSRASHTRPKRWIMEMNDSTS